MLLRSKTVSRREKRQTKFITENSSLDSVHKEANLNEVYHWLNVVNIASILIIRLNANSNTI